MNTAVPGTRATRSRARRENSVGSGTVSVRSMPIRLPRPQFQVLIMPYSTAAAASTIQPPAGTRSMLALKKDTSTIRNRPVHSAANNSGRRQRQRMARNSMPVVMIMVVLMATP